MLDILFLDTKHNLSVITINDVVVMVYKVFLEKLLIWNINKFEANKIYNIYFLFGNVSGET